VVNEAVLVNERKRIIGLWGVAGNATKRGVKDGEGRKNRTSVQSEWNRQQVGGSRREITRSHPASSQTMGGEGEGRWTRGGGWGLGDVTGEDQKKQTKNRGKQTVGENREFSQKDEAKESKTAQKGSKGSSGGFGCRTRKERNRLATGLAWLGAGKRGGKAGTRSKPGSKFLGKN